MVKIFAFIDLAKNISFMDGHKLDSVWKLPLPPGAIGPEPELLIVWELDAARGLEHLTQGYSDLTT